MILGLGLRSRILRGGNVECLIAEPVGVRRHGVVDGKWRVGEGVERRSVDIVGEKEQVSLLELGFDEVEGVDVGVDVEDALRSVDLVRSLYIEKTLTKPLYADRNGSVEVRECATMETNASPVRRR